ncbi:MAG: hypothetical protein WC404_00095 [Candidatus Omnitrophota bacterium]|jgi:hypothetical protein
MKEYRPNIIISVEILPGTDIKDAIEEAKKLANRFIVAYIHFDFNGTSFSVSSRADTKLLVEQYHQNKNKFIVG